jgi:hypothetical protein
MAVTLPRRMFYLSKKRCAGEFLGGIADGDAFAGRHISLSAEFCRCGCFEESILANKYLGGSQFARWAAGGFISSPGFAAVIE